jgi:hypothetical protein
MRRRFKLIAQRTPIPPGTAAPPKGQPLTRSPQAILTQSYLGSFLFLAALALSLGSFIGKATAEEQTPEQRKMLIEGAHLWSIYCNQCHNARPGSQFSPAQWDAITMHMKTLSNMPAKDMRAIKELLKLH